MCCDEREKAEGEVQVRRVGCPDVDVLSNAKLCRYMCVSVCMSQSPTRRVVKLWKG